MNEPSRPLSIYIIAGEESGDALGAALARALKEQAGGAIKLAGVGGRAMAAQGIASPFPIDDLSIVGLTAIPQKLPKIFRHIREATQAVLAARPDALVIVDSPDFTHRVARRVRQIIPSIPILDYVSPSVWAWRPGRARAMRAYMDRVLAILPFEPEAYVRLKGPPCTYVGHPLIERLSELRPSPQEAARRQGDAAHRAGLAGQPLDRDQAAYRRSSAAALKAVAERAGAMEVVLPTVPHLARPRPRGGRRLGRGAAHCRRSGRKMGRLPLRPRGAGGIRDGDARACFIGRADGCGLPPASHRGDHRADDPHPIAACRASSWPIWCSARMRFRSSSRRIARRTGSTAGAPAAAIRHAGARPAGRSLRAARRDHGHRQCARQAPRRRRSFLKSRRRRPRGLPQIGAARGAGAAARRRGRQQRYAPSVLTTQPSGLYHCRQSSC